MASEREVEDGDDDTGGGISGGSSGVEAERRPLSTVAFTCSYGKTRPRILGAMETGSSVLI